MADAPVMVIGDLRLVERKPTPAKGLHGVCCQCALGVVLKACAAAVMGDGARAFGGDCQTRDVVYALEGR